MYKINFEGGLDVDMFRKWYVGLFGLLGLVAGGFAGKVADKMVSGYCEWRDRRGYIEREIGDRRYSEEPKRQDRSEAWTRSDSLEQEHLEIEKESIFVERKKSRIELASKPIESKPVEASVKPDPKTIEPISVDPKTKESLFSRALKSIFGGPVIKKPHSIIVRSSNKEGKK